MKRYLKLIFLLLPLAGACSEPHQYAESRFAGEVVAPAGELRLEVSFRSGDVRLAGGEGLDYTATIRYCTLHTRPQVELEPADDEWNGSTLTVEVPGLEGVFFGFGGERNSMNLVVPDSLPVSMNLDLAGGDAVVDLSRIEVRRLYLDAGAGKTGVLFGATRQPPEEVSIESLHGDVSITGLAQASPSRTQVLCGVGSMHVDLGGEWRRGGEVSIDGAGGNLSLRLPSSIPVRLEVGRPWSREIELEGYEHRQVPVSGSVPGRVERVDRWFSEGYDTATRRLEIAIEAGTGQLRIEQEDFNP